MTALEQGGEPCNNFPFDGLKYNGHVGGVLGSDRVPMHCGGYHINPDNVFVSSNCYTMIGRFLLIVFYACGGMRTGIMPFLTTYFHVLA